MPPRPSSRIISQSAWSTSSGGSVPAGGGGTTGGPAPSLDIVADGDHLEAALSGLTPAC